jgi:pimeloyl-ACP methyl ester carboxylesterase
MRVQETIEIRPPAMHLAAMEPLRASFEGLNLLMSTPFLALAPQGDGHGVIVLPGFATDDYSTAILRRFLIGLGYDAHPWRLGWNLDHRTAGYRGEHIAAEIHRVADSTGRKVSLVGWSLGGVIAREAARRDPSHVRQVITIGSPLGGNPHANHIGQLYTLLSGQALDSPATRRRLALGPTPLPMPATAISSRTDGITAWENCQIEPDHQSENVEVHSSHFGLPLNARVYQIVADRLAQPEGNWVPFESQKASL